MADEGFFSERQGLIQPPPDIEFRDELPPRLREPIIRILRSYVPAPFLRERIEWVFDRYGIAALPSGDKVIKTEDEDSIDFVTVKSVLMNCDWFKVYDVIEDIFDGLVFYETELGGDPEDRERAYPLQNDINEYFKYAGIGWQMVDGKVVARGDDDFESTVRTADTELADAGRITAAERIKRAIRYLSARPQPDLSGAISHATGAMECVLDDITGEHMTLGKFLNRYPHLFSPTMKKALEGLWGFSSDEGARHGREGVEPSREDAEFIVAIAAAVTTYLNRQHPRP